MMNDDKKTVTIVLATFNGEKYISQQIESILSQTVLPDEIVVVDDCSTDKTAQIVNGILSKSNIKNKVIVHQTNKGVNQSFMDGINSSSSSYIMFCDQDDYWKKDKIEITQKALSLSNDIVMAVCNASITDENLKVTGKTLFDYIRLKLPFKDGLFCILPPEEMQNKLIKRNYATGMCMAFRRDVLTDLQVPEGMIYDYWIAWQLSNYGSSVFINKELVLYRQHGNNVVGTKKRKTIREYLSTRTSSMATKYQRYCSLNSIGIQSKTINKKINDAQLFYCDRLNLAQLNRFSATKTIIKNIIKQSYRDFTDKPAAEITKDFLEVIL